MSTVINNPGNRPTNRDDSEGVMGIIVGAVIILLLIIFFAVYGLPMISGSTPADAKPADDSSSVNVDVIVPSGDDEGSEDDDNAE